PHGREERRKFRTFAEALQMSFFRIPLEAQNKMLGIFGALGQFVGQAIFGGLQRFGGFLVIFLELFPARFVDSVTGVFDNHDVLSLLCRNAVRSRELASSAKLGTKLRSPIPYPTCLVGELCMSSYRCADRGCAV